MSRNTHTHTYTHIDTHIHTHKHTCKYYKYKSNVEATCMQVMHIRNARGTQSWRILTVTFRS